MKRAGHLRSQRSPRSVGAAITALVCSVVRSFFGYLEGGR